LVVAGWSAGLAYAFDVRQTSLDDHVRTYLDGRLTAAEHHARAALQAICNAYNYLDDLTHDYPGSLVEVKSGEMKALEDLLDHCHGLIHRYGELVGGLFGCYLEHKDDGWYDGCLVSLLHLRFGNSTGFTARYICVICGAAAGDCDHHPREKYPRMAQVTSNGYCDICVDSCQDHQPGVTYEVQAGFRLADIDVLEVSMVSRPRDPLTRITQRSVDPQMIVDRLGRLPEPGEPVLCHACMYPCDGFRHLDD
jgi:hypothetical protein